MDFSWINKRDFFEVLLLTLPLYFCLVYLLVPDIRHTALLTGTCLDPSSLTSCNPMPSYLSSYFFLSCIFVPFISGFLAFIYYRIKNSLSLKRSAFMLVLILFSTFLFYAVFVVFIFLILASLNVLIPISSGR